MPRPCGVFIGQLAHPSVAVEGTLTKFSLPSRTGWKLSVADGRVLNVFSKAPLEGQMPNDGPVLLGDIADGAVEADLSKCKWLAHQGLGTGPTAARVRESWFAAFNFIGEDQLREGQVGLRRPQLGALHAIHAHWSTKSDVATVVMPTGTGKTETMLATMISGMCTRVIAAPNVCSMPVNAKSLTYAQRPQPLRTCRLQGRAADLAQHVPTVCGAFSAADKGVLTCLWLSSVVSSAPSFGVAPACVLRWS